ncbi:MAG: hypothetical protein Q8P68_05540 [Candidatus Peregrinibacteria bacterium]|nr:hypothetical protein [Candidatus Peregrinibacteria bacterium]MDZ4245025.1 hypothetical protein [Candidatus Gracilibacteria bacterium]
MKLFDAIFQILLKQEKKLILGGDLYIYIIVSRDDKYGTEKVSYYLEFEHNADKSWAAEEHHPTRRQIEEHLTKIILERDERTKEIADFLNKNSKKSDNPLKDGGSILEVLKRDHPETVKMVETYGTTKKLKDAAAELIIEVLKARGDSEKIGSSDKETYEEFWYEEADNKFHYQEGDALAYGHPNFEKTFDEKEFRKFLKDIWIDVKDGFVTGRGNVGIFMPYWLKERGVESLREYIESKKK